MPLFRFLLHLAPRSRFASSVDVVLCYHAIGYSDWAFSVAPAEFASQINFLSRHFTIVSLSDLSSRPNHTSRPRVAITFDDGYQSVYRYARPLFARLGLSATVFALENPIGTSTFPRLPLLRIAQMQALTKSGWAIGYHTSTHPDLTKVNPSRLHAEIVTGKTRLESQLGSRLRFMAFPFGQYNKSVIAIAQQHFVRLLTANGGPASSTSHPRLIDRVTISRHLTTDDFASLLTPIGLTLNRVFTFIWRIWDTFSL